VDHPPTQPGAAMQRRARSRDSCRTISPHWP
jgi:hypothetical protein